MAAGSADASMVATRVALAGSALGIDVSALVPRLVDVADGPLRSPLVWTDADAQLLGVSAHLSEDALLARRMTVLAAGLGEARALVRTAMARPGEVTIERWSDHRAAVMRSGAATLAADVAALEAVGGDAGAVRAAAALVGRLAGDGEIPRLVRCTLRREAPSRYELGVRTSGPVVDQIAALAAELAIGDAQLPLLARVHPIFARDRPVLLRVALAGADDAPRLAIVYGPQSLDHALRAVTGLATRDDAAKRFGTLTGSLGSEQVAGLELHLGPVDPAPLRIAIAM